jgi:lysozyme family protein
MFSFQALKDSYERNWANLKIRPERADQVNQVANRLLKGKSIYQQIEAKTGVPQWFAALCHYRESNCDFGTYLGNGQSLNQVTTIVPKGRGPFTGPDAFVNGAIDALRLEGFVGSSDWSIARTLFRLEGFNGFGYHSKGVNSPYLYGGSTLYGPLEARAGKFVRDHVFDPNTVDTQLGTAVILQALIALDPSIKFDQHPPLMGGATEPEDDLAETILLVQQALNKLGANPQLVEDGRNGPKTKAAVSHFQQQNGLQDTGLPDAATIAALTIKASEPVRTNLPAVQPPAVAPAVDLSPLLQRLEDLVKAVQSSSASPPTQPSDPISLIQKILPMLPQRAATPGMTTLGTMPPAAGPTSVDQLKQVIDLANALLGKSGTPALGQVNGALGETIGNLLNGKKTTLGVVGSLLSTSLGSVTSLPTDQGLAGVLGTIVASAPGLSKFTLPLSLVFTLWGVLGKLEKWAQGTAPAPKPQT